MGVRYVEPDTVSENPEEPVLEIVVGVERTGNASDEAKMIEAAQALIKAIERAIRMLEAQSPSRIISILGVAISVGALLNEILRTDFIVTDRTNFGNNGVGGADRIPVGRNADLINFKAIVGDSANPSANYYAHPGFTNGEGMLALVLHEAFHLTAQGFQFYQDSLAAWIARGGTAANFYTGPLAINLELMANAFTLDFLGILNVPFNLAFPPVQPTQPPQDPGDVP